MHYGAFFDDLSDDLIQLSEVLSKMALIDKRFSDIVSDIVPRPDFFLTDSERYPQASNFRACLA